MRTQGYRIHGQTICGGVDSDTRFGNRAGAHLECWNDGGPTNVLNGTVGAIPARISFDLYLTNHLTQGVSWVAPVSLPLSTARGLTRYLTTARGWGPGQKRRSYPSVSILPTLTVLGPSGVSPRCQPQAVSCCPVGSYNRQGTASRIRCSSSERVEGDLEAQRSVAMCPRA